MKIASDARKIVPHRDTDGGEVFTVADSGQH